MLSPSQRPERPGTSTDPIHDRIAKCRSAWRAWSVACSREPEWEFAQHETDDRQRRGGVD